jgi:arabinose-5-phosphate isomerase
MSGKDIMSQPKASELIALAIDTIEREARAVASVKEQCGPSLMAAADLIFHCQGHVLVAGAGTSRAIAQRFAHLLACCGTPGLFISAADAIHGGSGAVTARDVVYIISKGGQSEEINQFAGICKGNGAKIIAHTEKPDSPLGRMSDAVYHIVAPEGVDPYGMIATGSSLANGAACDALCCVLLKMRGYTQEQFGRTHPGGAVGKMVAEGP